MKKLMTIAVSTTAILASGMAMATDRITVAAMKDVPAIKVIAAKQNVVATVEASNKKNAMLSRKQLMALESEWTQQAVKGSGPLLAKVMDNGLAQALKTEIQDSKGKYVSALVMNNKGINVAQTAITKHYSQANHVVWRKSYRLGPKAVYISRSHRNRITGQRYVTIAVPVLNAQHQAIGAFALDVNFKSLGIKENNWG